MEFRRICKNYCALRMSVGASLILSIFRNSVESVRFVCYYYSQVICIVEERMMENRNQELAEKYFNSGMENSKNDEFELAIEDYTKAIALKPDYAEAYYYRGGSWLRLGEKEKAKEDLTAARDLRMDDIIALDKIGQDYERAWKILGNM